MLYIQIEMVFWVGKHFSGIRIAMILNALHFGCCILYIRELYSFLSSFVTLHIYIGRLYKCFEMLTTTSQQQPNIHIHAERERERAMAIATATAQHLFTFYSLFFVALRLSRVLAARYAYSAFIYLLCFMFEVEVIEHNEFSAVSS